jgi:hypothetical protein
MRRPSTVSVRSVIARPASRCQRWPCAARSAEVSVQATGGVLRCVVISAILLISIGRLFVIT